MEACSLVALWCTRLGTAPELAVRVAVGRTGPRRISLCRWAAVAVSRRWTVAVVVEQLLQYKVLGGICLLTRTRQDHLASLIRRRAFRQGEVVGVHEEKGRWESDRVKRHCPPWKSTAAPGANCGMSFLPTHPVRNLPCAILHLNVPAPWYCIPLDSRTWQVC